MRPKVKIIIHANEKSLTICLKEMEDKEEWKNRLNRNFYIAKYQGNM